jgi:hypothetical protein
MRRSAFHSFSYFTNLKGFISLKIPVAIQQGFSGGGEGNRTPVRRFRSMVFSERSLSFEFRLVGRREAGCLLRYLDFTGIASKI